jgi:hypothetical protein
MTTVSDVIHEAPVTGSGVVINCTATLTKSPATVFPGMLNVGLAMSGLLIIDGGPDICTQL